MNRTKILTWQRDRIPTWMLTVVMATAIALSLMWGVNPAAADTAPASTPTVAPTTVATVAPTTVATVAPTTVATVAPTTVATVAPTTVATIAPTATATAASRSVRTRAVVGSRTVNSNPTDCLNVAPANDCPLILKLVAAAPADTDEAKYRVGEVVKVDIVISNEMTTDLAINGVQAYIDFDTTKMALVSSTGMVVPVSTASDIPVPSYGSGASVDGDIVTTDDSNYVFGGSPQVFKNTYTTDGSTGQINLDIGVAFGVASGTSGVTVAQSGSKTVGHFYVRILLNPITSGTNAVPATDVISSLILKPTTNPNRYSLIAPADANSAVDQVMAKVENPTLAITETRVEVQVSPSTIYPDSDSGWRVGDIVPVDIKIKATTKAPYITSVKTAFTFKEAEFVLVRTDTDSTPVIASDSDKAITPAAGFVALPAGNKYVAGTDGAVTIILEKRNVDAPVALAMAKDAVVLIATAYLRVKTNADRNNTVTIPGVGDEIGVTSHRFFDNPATQGADRDFKVTVTKAANPTVIIKETKVDLSLVPAEPAGDSVRRIGDIVPVKLVLKPTTKARSINAVSAKFTYNPAEFQLQQSNAKALKTVDDTFLVAADGNTTVSATTATVSASVASITAFVSKADTGLLTLESGTEYDVATFWVRPLKKGSLTITLDTANIVSAVGEKTAAIPPVIAFAVTTTAINGTIAPVYGTIGITLKTRSPFAENPGLDFSVEGWATGNVTVVDGRYLDVAVWVNADTDDQKQASIYIVDLDFDTTQLTFTTPTEWQTGVGNYKLGPVVPDPTAIIVNGSQLKISLKTNLSALAQPEEIIRLRFEVTKNSSNPTNQVKLKVANTTVLRQFSGFVPDANDIYANVRDSVNTLPNYPSTPAVANVNTQLGEFDSAPVITRQYPASLQMRPRLQGRTVTSPAERFNQAVVVTLINPITNFPVARHKTVDNPEAVKYANAYYVNDMQYDWWLSAQYAQGSTITKPVAVLSKLNGSTYAEDDISDLEPGTYDVFLKGPTSVGILVKGVPFGPNEAKKIDGIILREGDIDHDEKVDSTDFSLFSPAYNTAGTVTMVAGPGSADFNQSGYVDMLDYSLLASNFDSVTAGPDEPPVGDALGNVRVARVNTSSAYTLPAIALTQATTTYAVGDVVPVSVTLNPGSRTVDGVQIVVRAGNGAELVGTNAFVKATSSPLSLIFSDAVNAGRNLIELALGRTTRTSPVSESTTLGTVNVKITGSVTGNLLTVDANGNGQFETMIAGGGDNLLDPSTYYVAPVPAPAVSGGSNSSSGGNGSASAAPARASAPSRAPAPAPVASAPVAAPMSPALSEDTVRGIVSVAIPGREPVELKTGLATLVPDAYCPTVRHNTYIRLEDEGIAGATFGVEAGGVLSWVTPDQAGCVDWSAISEGGLTFTKETIMQFQLARAVPGALLWVLSGDRNGELYEVDPNGIATYITGENFAANQDHFRQVWANVIPVSTSQVDGLASRGAVSR